MTKQPEIPPFIKPRTEVEIARDQLIQSVKTARRSVKLAAVLASLPILVSLMPAKVDAQSATYYHPSLAGRTMANGKPYRPSAMTAASNAYKLGTRLRVINRKTGKAVVVTVTDRCGNCSIDLSKGAFQRIAPLKQGRVSVRIQRL